MMFTLPVYVCFDSHIHIHTHTYIGGRAQQRKGCARRYNTRKAAWKRCGHKVTSQQHQDKRGVYCAAWFAQIGGMCMYVCVYMYMYRVHFATALRQRRRLLCSMICWDWRYVYVYMRIYVCMYMYVCMYVYVMTQKEAIVQCDLGMCMYLCVYMYVCMYVLR